MQTTPEQQTEQAPAKPDTLISLDPGERVLATLNQDGSRRWIRPKPSRGTTWKRRRIVAYGLIALFTILPHLRLSGKPLVLLDIARREFTLFGTTFLPTDTLLLAMLFLMIFASVFFVTALLGRAWCGWACPQTVYMEFLYRPIERLFDGEPGKRKPKKAKGLRSFGKYAVFLLCSMFIAHTFLAYFVGTDALREWMTRSPLEHPISFAIMVFVTGAMMFDFGFFREQVCMIMCPYGRMQSVMLDRDSLIVGYDRKRGEPRGKVRRSRSKASADVSLPVVEGGLPVAIVEEDRKGDCIDCTMCVQTCPTGIDIRDGLQLECVHCAQCIDACDDIMAKIGKPPGLIRYSSQAGFDGAKRRVLRPRVFIYPTIILAAMTVFILSLSGKTDGAEILALRGPGMPFNVLSSGEVSNQIRVRLTNRNDETLSFSLSLRGPEGVRLASDPGTITVDPYQQEAAVLSIAADPSMFVDGGCPVTIIATASDGTTTETVYRLIGPSKTTNPTPAAQEPGS